MCVLQAQVAATLKCLSVCPVAAWGGRGQGHWRYLCFPLLPNISTHADYRAVANPPSIDSQGFHSLQASEQGAEKKNESDTHQHTL